MGAGVEIKDYSCASYPAKMKTLVQGGHHVALLREGAILVTNLSTHPINGVDWMRRYRCDLSPRPLSKNNSGVGLSLHKQAQKKQKASCRSDRKSFFAQVNDRRFSAQS
jgi:hypothetical protein